MIDALRRHRVVEAGRFCYNACKLLRLLVSHSVTIQFNEDDDPHHAASNSVSAHTDNVCGDPGDLVGSIAGHRSQHHLGVQRSHSFTSQGEVSHNSIHRQPTLHGGLRLGGGGGGGGSGEHDAIHRQASNGSGHGRHHRGGHHGHRYNAKIV